MQVKFLAVPSAVAAAITAILIASGPAQKHIDCEAAIQTDDGVIQSTFRACGSGEAVDDIAIHESHPAILEMWCSDPVTDTACTPGFVDIDRNALGCKCCAGPDCTRGPGPAVLLRNCLGTDCFPRPCSSLVSICGDSDCTLPVECRAYEVH